MKIEKKKSLTEVYFNSISNCNKMLKAKMQFKTKTNFNCPLFICTVSGVFDSKTPIEVNDLNKMFNFKFILH